MRVTEFILGDWDINIATPLATVRVVMEGYTEVCFALLGIMLLASLAIGFWLSQMAQRPVRSISETANHIRSDNLDERIPVADVQDEVSDLARILNQMFDRLDQIIEELLFLSRAEARAITLELHPVDPRRFLQAFAQDARVLAEHHGVRYAHTHDGEVAVAFDDKRPRQVLLNLLSNALAVSH